MTDSIFSPYITWILIFVFLPTALLWIFYFKTMLKYKKIFLPRVISGIIAGIIWDVFAYKSGIWYWPEDCCSFPRVYGYPLEEVIYITGTIVMISTITIAVKETVERRKKWS